MTSIRFFILMQMSTIINESPKLYPPAVSLRRNAGREVKLGKLIIAANIDLISSSHV